MRKKYKFRTFFPCLLFALCNFTSFFVYGQNEVSVDKFTGTAHVAIPLYTVQSRGVSLPLSLHYAASGIKVEESGRSRATGWVLAGLPKIEREVRDLPDDIVADDGAGERRFGWLTPGRNVPAKAASLPSPNSTTACSAAENTALTVLNDIAATPLYSNGGTSHDIYDAEPDVFFYNVPGHNGKFIFDSQLRIQLIPYDNVRITYTKGANGSLSSFEVYTPEGHHYTFDVTDETKEQSSAQQVPPFFYRHYFNYKLNSGLSYYTTWQVSSISLPQQAGGSGNLPQATVATFNYTQFTDTEAGNELKQLFWSGTAVGQTMYRAAFGISTYQLNQITTSTTIVNFNYDNSTDVLGGPLNSIYVNAVAGGQRTTIEQIRLNYTFVNPTTVASRIYYDSYGTQITGYVPARRFLSDISISNGCTPLAIYAFEYQTPDNLPPAACVERDYFGYYNGNKAKTPVPQLYVYPQLDPSTTPGGVYRLFEAPALAGGLLLPGADRRPAQVLADFQQTTLAGTLTSVKLPTGGKISFDYEPHRFYDPVAQTYHNGGGVRIKAVHWRDNLGSAEQVRQYQYVQALGEASGRLLHTPRLAITNSGAATQASPLAQWQAATITALDDLAPDLFETRTVGYGRVVEQMAGRGQSVYTFSLAALPEDAVTAGNLRTVTGLARVVSSRRPQTCPNTGLYQQGADVYPFLQATNYEQERGNLLSVSQQTEPTVGGASQTVQSDAFQYGYVPVGTDSQVRGVNYEPLTATPGVYAYTSYLLKTGFVYALLSQIHTVVDQTRPTQSITTITRYSYNSRGQVATTVKQNSDGSYLRTRLKYAADFAGTTTPAGPALAAVRQRVNIENITQEPLETINEVVPLGSGPKVTSVTTNMFVLEDGCTRPYQQFSWQPAQPVSNNSAAYDSTRIQNVGGVDELIVNAQARQRPTITFEKVTQQLVVTDAYTTSGRRRIASLPTVDGNSIKLQVQNARLSEVLFSDFENQTTRDFTYTGALVTTSVHTGTQALNLTGAVLTHTLPESTRGNYQLSLWVQNTTGSAAYIDVTIDGATAVMKSLQAGMGWQLLEIPLSLANLSSPRTSHMLQLAPSSGSTILVDDVLLLPALATATSTTYDGQYRKTAQTDATNQTLYYSYDPAGNEAIVSDHNKSIIKQVTKVVAGRAPAYSLDFSVSGDLIDQNQVTFLASSSCIPNVQYTWHCIDPLTGQTVFTTPASSSPSLPYTFATDGQTKDYQVTVTATAQGHQLSQTRTVTVLAGPWQVQLSMCGTTSLDACTGTYYSQACGSGSADNHIIFTAAVSNYIACSAFTYNWEIAYGNAGSNSNWQVLNNSAGNSYQLDMPCGSQSFRVRCTVRGCNRIGVSNESGFSVNYRDASGHLCDGVPMGGIVNQPGY